MGGTNGKKALHVATFFGMVSLRARWQRPSTTKRDLTYLDAHLHVRRSGQPAKDLRRQRALRSFLHENAGARWKRAEPNTPKMMLSQPCVERRRHGRNNPSAVYRSKNGGWERIRGSAC